MLNFVQTGFLLALAAIAIPVLVHLLSRWQVRRIELGTMKFLQEVITEAAARRRIRRWLLLATRISILALLAMLFARPFLLEARQRDGNRLRIVLVDRSASMAMQGAAGRLIDDAVTAAKESLLDLGDDAQIIWAWFDRNVEELTKTQQQGQPLSALVQAPSMLTGDTDYRSALSWARDRITREAKAHSDIVLVTDLQQSGFVAAAAEDESLEFPSDVPVKVIDVGRPAASNLSITSLSTLSTSPPPRNPVVIDAILFNYGSLPMEEIAVSATANSGERTRRVKKTINIPNEQAQEVSFDFGVLEAGVWQVTVGVDVEDDLAVDNRRGIALNISEPYPVLILEPGAKGQRRTQPSYFLHTALDQTRAVATSLVKFDASIEYLHDGAMNSIKPGYKMIVVADAGGIQPTQIDRLEKAVRGGASLLAFAGNAVRPEAFAAYKQAGLSPGTLQSHARSGVTPFRLSLVNNSVSMLEPFRDPQHGDLGRLRFNSVLRVDLDPTTKVHAWFDQRHPAITEHTLGAGRVVWFMSSAADESLNCWNTSPLFLPVVQQMVSELLGMTGEGPVRFRFTGELMPVATGKESSTANRFETPGFFIDGGATYVVNTSANESDPTRGTVEDFFEHYQLSHFPDVEDGNPNQLNSERRKEFWPWLAAVGLVLLVVEFSLANRTPA